MELKYIANVRLPTEKAHGIQIIKMCEAFAGQGIKVTLIIPQRKQINPDFKNKNIYDYYQVKKNFRIKKLFNIDLLPLHQIGINAGSLAYTIQEISFAITATLLTFSHQLVYTRSKTTAFLRGILGKRTIYESHDSVKKTFINQLVAKKSSFVICITKSIQQSWKKLGAKTLYAPDGVSKEFFVTITKTTARKKLKLSQKQTIVLYTGNLYSWKGVDTLVDSAKLLPQYHFYFVGGSVIDHNIQPFRLKTKSTKNIHVIGHRPYKEIPIWLRAADVLILPNSAKTKKAREDTSPLKLFEYMASATPILASKVLSLTEIINKNHATFFIPDNFQDLATNTTKVLTTKTAKIKAKSAQKKARTFLWENRAQKILKEIKWVLPAKSPEIN